MCNNPEENKRIVLDGLERRKAARNQARREARLNQFERDMISAVNKNRAGSVMERKLSDTGRIAQAEAAARQVARREARKKEWEREAAANNAIKMYVWCCLALLVLAILAPLPMWAAITTIAGLAVFPMAYIIRLYIMPETMQGVA